MHTKSSMFISQRIFKTVCCFLVILFVTHSAFAQFDNITSDVEKDKPQKFKTRTLKSEKTGQKKFTLPRRIIQNTVSHYNYYFNANNRLNQVIERARIANHDDYSKLLPFYSYTLNSTSAQAGELDSVIYKATAGILLHDLRSDWVDNFYLLIGKAYLLRKDFDSASMTFQFINYNLAPKKKHDEDQQLVGSNINGGGSTVSIANKENTNIIKRAFTLPPSRNDAFVWQIRSLTETGDYGEASGLINTLQNDPNFPSRLAPALEEANAFWFYKQGLYDSAAFHLEKALPNAADQQEKARSEYLLAQLYDLLKNKEKASEFYDLAARHTTNPLMDIYANLSKAKMYNVDEPNEMDFSIATLLKMARRDKFVAYRDIVYYSAGEIALQKPDTAAAELFYNRSIHYNETNILYKDKAFLRLADINYNRKNYKLAFANYDSLEIADTSLGDIAKIEERRDYLEKIVDQINIIEREDSLQLLALMPVNDREVFVKKLSKRLRKERGLKEEENYNVNPSAVFDNNKTLPELFSSNPQGEWYFYNAAIKSKGFSEFRSRWGKRQNIDNWRRISNNGNANDNADNNNDNSIVDNNTLPSSSFDADATNNSGLNNNGLNSNGITTGINNNGINTIGTNSNLQNNSPNNGATDPFVGNNSKSANLDNSGFNPNGSYSNQNNTANNNFNNPNYNNGVNNTFPNNNSSLNNTTYNNNNLNNGVNNNINNGTINNNNYPNNGVNNNPNNSNYPNTSNLNNNGFNNNSNYPNSNLNNNGFNNNGINNNNYPNNNYPNSNLNNSGFNNNGVNNNNYPNNSSNNYPNSNFNNNGFNNNGMNNNNGFNNNNYPNNSNFNNGTSLLANDNSGMMSMGGMGDVDAIEPTPAQSFQRMNKRSKPVVLEDISYEGMMRNIPDNDEKLRASNARIANALFMLGTLYQNTIEDYSSAVEAYEKSLKLFPDSLYGGELYMNLSYCYGKLGNTAKADYYKKLLTTKFKESTYAAHILNPKKPVSTDKNPKATKAYENIYNLFIEGQFDKALAEKKIADSLYGENYWSPQLLYIESVYYVRQRNDSLAIITLSNIINNYPNSPLKNKAANMIDVLSRRYDIENYLTNLKIERLKEDSQIVIREDLQRVNRVPSLVQNSSTVRQNNPAIKDSMNTNPVTPAKNDTAQTTIKPAVMASSYSFAPETLQYVVMLLDKVDPVYISEARNAFNRFNRQTSSTPKIEITRDTLDKERSLLVFSQFENADAAIAYADKLKKNAASEVSWLPANKYSFFITSESNLQLLKSKKDLQNYIKLLSTKYPGKF